MSSAIFIVIWLVVMLGTSALSIAMYVCGSLGMYTMAKRRGINHPWLAWIPVANSWTLGCISDQYQQVARGRFTGRRKALLTLNIIMVTLGVGVFVLYFGLVLSAVMPLLQAPNLSPADLENFTVTGIDASMLPMFLVLGLAGLVAGVLGIVYTVIGYVAYYDLFRSSNPGNAVLFLVLSIFFNFTLPFFVLACRNKDLGMTPPAAVIPPENY